MIEFQLSVVNLSKTNSNKKGWLLQTQFNLEHKLSAQVGEPTNEMWSPVPMVGGGGDDGSVKTFWSYPVW